MLLFCRHMGTPSICVCDPDLGHMASASPFPQKCAGNALLQLDGRQRRGQTHFLLGGREEPDVLDSQPHRTFGDSSALMRISHPLSSSSAQGEGSLSETQDAVELYLAPDVDRSPVHEKFRKADGMCEVPYALLLNP